VLCVADCMFCAFASNGCALAENLPWDGFLVCLTAMTLRQVLLVLLALLLLQVFGDVAVGASAGRGRCRDRCRGSCRGRGCGGCRCCGCGCGCCLLWL